MGVSNELEGECLQHMVANGLPFSGPIEADGKIHRVSLDAKRGQPDEWFIGFEGISSKGTPYLAVTYGSWVGSQKYVYKSYEDSKTLSKEELNSIIAAEEVRHKAVNEQLQKEIEERIQNARKAWERASIEPDSEGHVTYLERKKVKYYGVRFGRDKTGSAVVVIPIKNLEGDVQGVQYIMASGEKRIYGAKKGNFYLIGEISDTSHIRIAEGYATAASIHEALKDPVVVAFDCGNLSPVIANLRSKYHHHKITIMADDDRHTEGNPGKAKAEAAAKLYNCDVRFPKFSGEPVKDGSLSDFNDLHVHFGLNEIRDQVLGKKNLYAIDIGPFLVKDIPLRKNIISPWLNEGELAMIYAERGCGKTYLALFIACAIAGGWNFFNWVISARKRVLYIDGEMPAWALQERLKQITFGRPPIENGYLKIIAQGLQESGIEDIGTKKGQEDINEYIDEFDVVILDNLSTLLKSGEENQAESWRLVQDWIVSLRKAGKSVIIIHHAGKNKTSRGTSKKEDTLDTIIELRRPKEYSAEEGAKFEVRFVKARAFQGDAAAPIEVNLITTEQGGLDWVYTTIENRELSEVIAMTKAGKTQRQIAEAIGVSAPTVNRMIQKAKAAGVY